MPDTGLRLADLDRRRHNRALLGLPCDPGGRLLDAQGRRHRQRPQHHQRHRDSHRRPHTPADHGRLQPGLDHKPDRRHLHLQLKRRRLRPSRCASTAAPGSPAPAPSSTAASATALTPSTSAQPTPRATPTSPPPRSPGRSTPPHPTRQSLAARRTDKLHRRHLLLHLQRGLLDLRMPPRRRRLGNVHDAEFLRLARRGLAHLPGARDRRRGEHGRDAGNLHLVDRRHQPDRLDDLACERGARPATILLASNSADGGSGLASVVFQRSPAGAGTWTATPASWDTTLVADGNWDLRV